MAALRDVLNQINGIKKTKQITKAMNLVASAKLRQAQLRIERFRPYAKKFYNILEHVGTGGDIGVHPLLGAREEIKHVGIVLITSDRGLCGGFNSMLIQKALRLARAKKKEGKFVHFYCLGKKGFEAVKKAGYVITANYPEALNTFNFSLASSIGTEIIKRYIIGEFDEVHLVYGEFKSVARQEAVELLLLPISSKNEDDNSNKKEEIRGSEYVFEPSREDLLAEMLPRFINVQVYRGMLDAAASEHAARRSAMDNASRACDDMSGQLTLLYNKTRQAAITADLMDIVGGAEALKR